MMDEYPPTKSDLHHRVSTWAGNLFVSLAEKGFGLCGHAWRHYKRVLFEFTSLYAPVDTHDAHR
jgi:hypothetical protein